MEGFGLRGSVEELRCGVGVGEVGELCSEAEI